MDDYHYENCPFCGATAIVKSRYSNKTGRYYWFVACVRCRAQTGLYDGSGSAVDAWNIRVDKEGKEE